MVRGSQGECAAAYKACRAAKTNSYRSYFTADLELRDQHHDRDRLGCGAANADTGSTAPTTRATLNVPNRAIREDPNRARASSS